MTMIEVPEEKVEAVKAILGEEFKEIDNLQDLVGEKYLFQCARYFYYGKVTNVTPTHIVLKEAGIVFDVGAYDAKEAADMQLVSNKTIYLMRQAVESFFKTKW